MEGILDILAQVRGYFHQNLFFGIGVLLLASFFGLYMTVRAPLTASMDRAVLDEAESAPLPPLTEPLSSPDYPAPLRSVQLISSPGEAQVVDFSVGDYQVVMIIDRELDI